MIKISLTLDRYLREHQISQYEVMKRTQISPPTIRSYYRNTLRRYDADILEKFCDALHCNLSDLIECVDIEEENDK